MSNFTYFKDAEIEGLDLELVAMLDRARHRADVPFVITDGIRTSDTNNDPNAVKDSAHLKGLAVDLRCHDSHALWRILEAIFFVGFKRIGIYFNLSGGIASPTHLHVDADLTKPQEVAWLTGEK